MTTINCLFVDDYSYEDIFKIKIKENETVGNLVEAIKKRNIGFGGDGLKILKIDLPLGTLSDKLALIESKSFVNIKTFLGGEELPSTKLISECFDTGEHYIVIDPPSGRFTFKKCVSENKLVVGDKIIYNDNNTCLEGTIVNISNTFQIKCTKVKEYCLDSFSKFIKLAISPYDIESEHWKNLSIELSESKEKFIWRDFRRRMLNRNLKGTDLIDPVLEREKKNNEAKTEKHDADDIIYNRIRLCPPSIESSVKHTASSKFITINATISYGPSADKHVEVEQLYKLLVDKKDCIDRVLESQPVYFIGPSFHEDYNFPCITCWVTAPLSKSTLEQLGEIYGGEFKVVCEMMETTNYASNSGGGSTSGEPCEMMETTNYASNNGGGSTSGGCSGPDGNNSDIKGRKVIKVSSGASVECEGHFQRFTIRVHFHANIHNDDDSDRMLFIDADIIECRAGALLNQNWKQLSSLGRGYFLESATISFSPITDATNNRSALYEREYYFPKVKNRIVESLVGTEKQGSLDLGTSSKAGFLMKKSESTKTISDEWHLKTWGCGTTGDHWMYERRSTDQILEIEPRSHISKWLIGEKMCGFRVKITQVLHFNFTVAGVLNRVVDFKPKLVMCPKVSHTLEIDFNGLEDFNEKFMSLERFRRGEDLILTVNNNTCTNVTDKTDSGFVNIDRSFYNEKN
ncbi:1390_t:CDS:2 [Funneliformis geosporum]|nr:1390_t:CDS:2 [Funneliformis geosporum]